MEEQPIKATNPFRAQVLHIPTQEMRRKPFKTSDRIFSDLRLAPVVRNGTFLGKRPLEYAKQAALINHTIDTLILNNKVDFVPSDERDGEVVVIRGLLVDRNPRKCFHFRIAVLRAQPIDKHEYHVVERALLSPDEVLAVGGDAVAGAGLVDDVFYKSGNCQSHVLRVTVHGPEFSSDELRPFTDRELVAERWRRFVNSESTNSEETANSGNSGSSSNANSSSSSPMEPVHALTTLIKVLKGPILLPANEQTQTINRHKTLLDAKIDVQFLFDRLNFGKDDEGNLVPPNLTEIPELREAYIRKAYELLFLARFAYLSRKNDFDTSYLYSDNMSQAFSALQEQDKFAATTAFRTDPGAKYAHFVLLSCSAHYQDELVIRCFENTVALDPGNKMHYVDCFRSIMSYKASTPQGRLQNYYQSQYQKGNMYGFLQYREALTALGVPQPHDHVADDVVLGLYKESCRQDPKNYSYFNEQLRLVAAVTDSTVLSTFLISELVPIRIALDELRIEEVTEDEVAITAYELRLDEILQYANFNPDSADLKFLHRCLLSLAVSRKLYVLMSYLERKVPDVVPNVVMLVSELADIIGVKMPASEFDIILRFQERLARSQPGDSSDFFQLRLALRVLSEEKKLNILDRFLQNGQIDSALLPAEDWPAGLANIGNTCYLNSLLQYYFCIKPLRETVMQFDGSKVASLKGKPRKIGGRFVEDSELLRSAQFVLRLQDLFHEMITTQTRCVQPSKELAYLSFLPLSQPVAFSKKPKSPEETPSTKETDSTETENPDIEMAEPELIELSDLESPEKPENPDPEFLETPENLENLEIPDNTILDRGQLEISDEQIASTIEIGRQQDVTECIENVTFQIETALEPEGSEKDGEQYDVIKKLFCGETKQTIVPLDENGQPGKSRSSVERFFSLIINVSDHPKDIYDSLDTYFSQDEMTLEEGRAHKVQTLSKVPEIIQFHVQRVLFDRERLIPYKLLEVIPFSENIYLDRYLDTEDPEILRKRQEVHTWKARMSELHAQKDALLQLDSETHLSVVDALKTTKKYLETKVLPADNLHINQSTIDVIDSQIHILKDKLSLINAELADLQNRVSAQFSLYQKIGYTLFAIFIHRGEASYGHYWVYIRDLARNVYRKYNDEMVTEVPVLEVFDFTEGNTATPYFMVYVKDELRDYVEPLKRQLQ